MLNFSAKRREDILLNLLSILSEVAKVPKISLSPHHGLFLREFIGPLGFCGNSSVPWDFLTYYTVFGIGKSFLITSQKLKPK